MKGGWDAGEALARVSTVQGCPGKLQFQRTQLKTTSHGLPMTNGQNLVQNELIGQKKSPVGGKVRGGKSLPPNTSLKVESDRIDGEKGPGVPSKLTLG